MGELNCYGILHNSSYTHKEDEEQFVIVTVIVRADACHLHRNTRLTLRTHQFCHQPTI